MVRTTTGSPQRTRRAQRKPTALLQSSVSSVSSAVHLLLLVSIATGCRTAQRAPVDPNMARALRVLNEQPIIDGHNDLPWRIREDSAHSMDVEAYDLTKTTRGMTDIARLKAGRVGGQFWSVYIPGEKNDKVYAPNGQVSS